MIRLVVRQGLAAFCASNGTASAARTTCAAGVVPNAFCVLGRLRSFGRRGSWRKTLWQSSGTRRRRGLRWRCTRRWMVGRVVDQCSATSCTGSGRTSTASTALRAGVVPNASSILRRLRRGGRWCGSGSISGWSGLLEAFHGLVTGGIAIVATSGENGHGTKCQSGQIS